MNKSQTSLKKSVFSLKMLGSCAFISYCAFTSTGYASTFEIDVPNGTSYVPSITAVAGTVTISGASQSAILEIDGAATYHANTVTEISTATVNLGAAGALGTASTNTITLADSALQMGVAQTVPNSIILAAGADVIDLNGKATTITPAITGTGTSLNIMGGAALTLSAAATHTAPTTIAATTTVNAGVASVMADATSLAVNGTFDMNTRNQTVNNLSGTGTVQSSTTPAALTVLPDAGSAFAGTLASTISAITVYDATSFLDLTNTATNAMTSGTITIGSAANQAGGLSINAADQLGTGTTSLVLAGGTLKQTAPLTITRAMNVTASSKFDAMNADATLTGALTGTGTTFTLANTGGTSADVITITPATTNSAFTGKFHVTEGTVALTDFNAIGAANATATPACTEISMLTGTKLRLDAPMTLPAVKFQ